MSTQSSHEGFVAFARTLADQELRTTTRHVPFTVRVTARGLEFMPSTGKPRPESFASLDQVVDEFIASGALQPGYYQQMTVNASYITTLLTMYQEQRGFTMPTRPPVGKR